MEVKTGRCGCIVSSDHLLESLYLFFNDFASLSMLPTVEDTGMRTLVSRHGAPL